MNVEDICPCVLVSYTCLLQVIHLSNVVCSRSKRLIVFTFLNSLAKLKVAIQHSSSYKRDRPQFFA